VRCALARDEPYIQCLPRLGGTPDPSSAPRTTPRVRGTPRTLGRRVIVLAGWPTPVPSSPPTPWGARSSRANRPRISPGGAFLPLVNRASHPLAVGPTSAEDVPACHPRLGRRVCACALFFSKLALHGERTTIPAPRSASTACARTRGGQLESPSVAVCHASYNARARSNGRTSRTLRRLQRRSLPADPCPQPRARDDAGRSPLALLPCILSVLGPIGAHRRCSLHTTKRPI
jgi:hypothetical protein